MITNICPNCGSEDVHTKGEYVLYVVKTSENTRNTRLLQLYWCDKCGRKFVGE